MENRTKKFSKNNQKIEAITQVLFIFNTDHMLEFQSII